MVKFAMLNAFKWLLKLVQIKNDLEEYQRIPYRPRKYM